MLPGGWTNVRTTDRIETRGTCADFGPLSKRRGHPLVRVEAPLGTARSCFPQNPEAARSELLAGLRNPLVRPAHFGWHIDCCLAASQASGTRSPTVKKPRDVLGTFGTMIGVLAIAATLAGCGGSKTGGPKGSGGAIQGAGGVKGTGGSGGMTGTAGSGGTTGTGGVAGSGSP